MDRGRAFPAKSIGHSADTYSSDAYSAAVRRRNTCWDCQSGGDRHR